MDPAQFDGVRRYVDFDESVTKLLRELHPHAEPFFHALIDDFYATIVRDPESAAILTGGAAQITRLKHALTEWLSSALSGPHDLAWVRQRKRIGLVHARINLPQRYMLTAMNRIRTGLLDVTDRSYRADPEQSRATGRAVNRLLDVELAIMLDSYHEYLSERIRGSERLATIGQLVATIGHELRNPLGIIESSLFLVRQRTSKLGIEDAQVEKHYEKIQKQVLVCSKTIGNLLDLARDRPPRRRRELLRPLLERIADEAGTPIELSVDAPDDVFVDVDPEELALVVSNLLSNAADAMGGEGKVEVSGQRNRGGTEITIRDHGPGIPPEIGDRVFDALFTTKARGTGLGLALCRRIVYSHGGELELVPSTEGACFRLWLPDSPSAPSVAG